MNDEITIRPPADDLELQQAIALRYEIFIREQERTRQVETDEFDAIAQHFVAVKEGVVVGTLRLYLLHAGDTEIKIGRVAVVKDLRGQGIGARLMNAAHAWAAGKYRFTYLHAQVSAAGFYKKLGYVPEGDIFMESGTRHIRMQRT